MLMRVFRYLRYSLVLVLGLVILSCGKQMTEEELFTAAQDNYGQAKYGESVKHYEELLEVYPESQNRAKAHFMVGYICANHLQDLDKARIHYTELVDNYPDHEFVDDAKFELENLGVDPAELDSILQKKIDKAESEIKKND